MMSTTTMRSETRVGHAFSRIATVLTVLLSACAPILSRTPVDGDSVSIAQLVGHWNGEYRSAETGRSGHITFELTAGNDTAQGDVVMTAPSNEAAGANGAGDVTRVPRQVSQLLTIRFVHVRGDEVLGVLDPYKDPSCGCPLTTRFRGRLRGDEIRGTYETQSSEFFHQPTGGEWYVKRVTLRAASRRN